LSYLIAVGVVIILGAAVGLVRHERSSGQGKADHLPSSLRNTPGLVTDSTITARDGWPEAIPTMHNLPAARP
jgi:hypothetical protein